MAKTRKQKEKLLDLYKEVLENKHFVMVELKSKVPAQSINLVRFFLREKGAALLVLKNKVFQKIARGYEPFKDLMLENVKALIVADTEDALLEALKEFEKLTDITRDELALRGEDEEFVKKFVPFEYTLAYVNKVLYSQDDAKRLASLPTKTELYGQFTGVLAGVLRGFVNVLNGNLTNFVNVLSNIKEAKAN